MALWERAVNYFMRNLFFLISIILLGVLSRLLPHPANFTPIGAIALFSGFYFKNKNYALLPLITMALSDLVISGYYGVVMFYVYGSFLLAFFIGRFFLQSSSPYNRILISSLSTSLLFFIVTNFAVWFHGTMYSKDLTGLLASYFAAIPFFRNTLLGDLFYSFTFFSALRFSLTFLKTQKIPSKGA